MFKKMVKTMVLWISVCVVIIGSTMETVDAKDVYLYTQNGMDYYSIAANDLTNPELPEGFFVHMVGVKDGKATDKMTYLFIIKGDPHYALDGNPYYVLVNGNDSMGSTLDAVAALVRGEVEKEAM